MSGHIYGVSKVSDGTWGATVDGQVISTHTSRDAAIAAMRNLASAGESSRSTFEQRLIDRTDFDPFGIER